MGILSYNSFVENKLNENIFSNIFNYFKKVKGGKEIEKLASGYQEDMKNIIRKKMDARKDAITKKVAYEKAKTDENKSEWQDAENAAKEKVELINKEYKSRENLFNSQSDELLDKYKESSPKLKTLIQIEKDKTIISILKFEQEELKKYGDMEGIKQRNQEIKEKSTEIKNLSKQLNVPEEKEQTFDYKKGDTIFYINDAGDNIIEVDVEDDKLDDNKKLAVKSKKGTNIKADLKQLSRDKESLEKK